MENIYSILLMIISMIEPFILDLFWRKMFPIKKGLRFFRYIGIVFLCSYFVGRTFLLNLLASNPVISYVITYSIMGFYFLYVVVFYQVNKKLAFNFLVIKYYMDTMTEFVITYALLLFVDISVISKLTVMRFISILFLQLCSYGVLYGLYKVKQHYQREFESNKMFYLFGISFVADIIIFGYIYCRSSVLDSNAFNILSLATLLYEASILLYCGFSLMSFQRNEREQKELLEFSNKHIHMLESNQKKIQETQKMIHDYKSHIGIMKTLLEGKMYEELERYIEELLPVVKRGSISKLYQSNTVLSVILFEKTSKANQEHIDIQCKIEVDDIRIPMVDLNSIVSNMLDNAIEATAKIRNRKERIIWFGVYVDEEDKTLTIECKNPYVRQPIRAEHGFFITTKEDKSTHGKGLGIIDEFVEKNDGDLDVYCEDHMFYVKAFFDMDKAVVKDEE